MRFWGFLAILWLCISNAYQTEANNTSFGSYVLLSEETAINDKQAETFCPRTYLLVSNNSDLTNRSDSTIDFTPRSAEDVELLLDTINWSLFVYTCDNETENIFSFPQFDQKFQNCCQVSSGHFTNKVSQVFTFIKSQDCIFSQCNESEIGPPFKQWIPLLIFGLICIFGNSVVIIQKIVGLRKSLTTGKGQQIYFALVLNLALSDLLMGIYLTAISFEIKYKVSQDIYFSESEFCNVLGVMNFISSQVSLSILVTISSFRYFSVVYPYKHQHLKVAVGSVIVTWLIWIILGILPVVQNDPLATAFNLGIRSQQTLTSNNFIPNFEADDLVNSISKLSHEESNIRYIFNEVTNFRTRGIWRKVLETLGLISFETENWRYVGYYNSQYACSISLVVDRAAHPTPNHFTLGIVLHNLFACFVIFSAYCLVVINILGYHDAASTPLKCCKKQKLLSRASTRSTHKDPKENENQLMFCRISIIVLTDIICWVPLCLIFLILWSIPENEVHDNFLPIYDRIQAAVLWILPINSILNPYIYSFHLWKGIFKKCKYTIQASLA